MAIIDVNYQGVLAVASSIDSTLKEAKPEFDKLKNRIEDMGSVWVSAKADGFTSDLNVLSQSLDNLIAKNDAFVSFLESAVAAYKADADSLAEAINNIAIASGGSN